MPSPSAVQPSTAPGDTSGTVAGVGSVGTSGNSSEYDKITRNDTGTVMLTEKATKLEPSEAIDGRAVEKDKGDGGLCRKRSRASMEKPPLSPRSKQTTRSPSQQPETVANTEKDVSKLPDPKQSKSGIDNSSQPKPQPMDVEKKSQAESASNSTSEGTDKLGASGNDKPSSPGSSGEEADIDSCSAGSGSGEGVSRRLHKLRAAIVCKDGHVTPAVHQHQGDCMVASRLLALWNAAPMERKTSSAQVNAKEPEITPSKATASVPPKATAPVLPKVAPPVPSKVATPVPPKVATPVPC